MTTGATNHMTTALPFTTVNCNHGAAARDP